MDFYTKAHPDVNDETYYTKAKTIRQSELKKFMASSKPVAVMDEGVRSEYTDNIDTLMDEYAKAIRDYIPMVDDPGETTASAKMQFFRPRQLSAFITRHTPIMKQIVDVINILADQFGSQITTEPKYAIINSYRQEADYPEAFDNEFNYHVAQYNPQQSFPIDKLFYVDSWLFNYLNSISRRDGGRFEQFMQAYENTIANTKPLFRMIKEYTEMIYKTPLQISPLPIFIYSGVSPWTITNIGLIQLLRNSPLQIYIKSFTLDLRVALHFADARIENECFPNANTGDLLGELSRYRIHMTEPQFKVIFIQKLVPKITKKGLHIVDGLSYISPEGSWEAEVLKGPSEYRLAGDPFMRVINDSQIVFIPVELQSIEAEYDVDAQLESVRKMYTDYINPDKGCSLATALTPESSPESTQESTQDSSSGKGKQTKKRNRRNNRKYSRKQL